jgi:hypothetical protein
MSNTYSLIQTITVSASTQASIEFTSIPASYTDLMLLLHTKSNAGSSSGNDFLTFNNSTSTFSGRRIEATNAGGTGAVTSNTVTNWSGFNQAASSAGNAFSNTKIYICGYKTSQNKPYFVFTTQDVNVSTTYMGYSSSLWSTASAITTIKLTPDSGSYIQNSTVSLYGILTA